MDKELLRNLQLKTLEVAKEFKRVCEKHNLRYFMGCGTLLGAVRHKGFIPWDDDMDFYMPKDDYEKLVEIDRLENIFKEKFIFKHWDKTQNYVCNYARLEDSTTTCISQGIASRNIDYKGGVGVDIFVLIGGAVGKI